MGAVSPTVGAERLEVELVELVELVDGSPRPAREMTFYVLLRWPQPPDV